MSKTINAKTVGLVAGIVFLFGGGATYYQYNAVADEKTKVADLEKQVPSQKELQQELADSQAKLAEFRSKVSHLEANVPDVAFVPTLLKELEQIGISNDIKVIGVRPMPEVATPTPPNEDGHKVEKKKDYDEINIEIKGRGTYDSVKAFLDSLQTFPKVIAVKTVSLSPQRDMGDHGAQQVEATVNIVAYVFPFEFVSPDAQKGHMTIDNAGNAAPGEMKTANNANGGNQ
ncbi:MAG TPA: type 4a pilus biogenesis protein PilO [Fimbriimonadaceae bacterium]|nr:type 4a pilus biogenesis protein PilO [Fimbriimonadaceae bacterium]